MVEIVEVGVSLGVVCSDFFCAPLVIGVDGVTDLSTQNHHLWQQRTMCDGFGLAKRMARGKYTLRNGHSNVTLDEIEGMVVLHFVSQSN